MWQKACARGGKGVHYDFLPKGNIMGIAALSAGVSGLQASQRALDNSAHNIANASTQGFQPQQVQFQESSPAGSGVSLSVQARALSAATPAATSGAAAGAAASTGNAPSGTDLASDLTNSLVYKAQFDLSAKVIKTSDETLGSLINIKA